MILATNNKGKLKEIREILNDYEIHSLSDINVNIDVEEDQDTFCENASKKAKEIYAVTGIATIADDSGLCIDALNNWPGVLTHRFLGENKTDRERNLAIIERVNEYANGDRRAHVVCNLVYFDGEKEIAGEGILYGYIVTEPRGENGFGFDEIFELENGKTLAELTKEEKNELSARYLATVDLKNKLRI